jgi:hypothetical protein
MGLGGNLAIKSFDKGFYLYNENGLHLYCQQSEKTFTHSLFSITNCGIVFNNDATLFATADFGGTVYIFSS